MENRGILSPMESDSAAAAARLRHDLGKYIRFSAPETIEADTAVLRERLRADVLATRRSALATHSAVEVFDQWRHEEAGHLPATAAAADTLERLASAMEDIRRLSSQIDALDRPGLERLDALTRVVVDACRSLLIEAKP
jgi:hypothetical protein